MYQDTVDIDSNETKTLTWFEILFKILITFEKNDQPSIKRTSVQF